MSFSCSKCNKELSSKQNLQKHEAKCNGLDKLQCELCHKKFKHASNKSQHKKNKVCERNRTMIINGGNVNIENIILNFGQENVNLDNAFIDECIKNHFRGIMEMIRKMFFSCPKDQRTIKKENKKDEFIYIKENGEWQKEFKNIVINKVLTKIFFPMFERIKDRNTEITEEDDRVARKKLIDEIEQFLIITDILSHKIRELQRLCYYDPDESLKNKKQRCQKIFKIIDELIYNETKK